MNAAPWPPSAGAFNASVRAGLLNSKTLAKADFFTGNLCLRTFRRRLCACGAGDWISTSCCTFSSQMQPTLQPVLQIYIRSCVSTHTASVQATTLCPGTARCRASQTHTHAQLPPTWQVIAEQDAKTSQLALMQPVTPERAHTELNVANLRYFNGSEETVTFMSKVKHKKEKSFTHTGWISRFL